MMLQGALPVVMASQPERAAERQIWVNFPHAGRDFPAGNFTLFSDVNPRPDPQDDAVPRDPTWPLNALWLLHAAGLEDWQGRGTGERVDEGTGRGGINGGCTERGRVCRVVLHFLRQRTDERHTLYRHDLTDLVHSKVCLARRD